MSTYRDYSGNVRYHTGNKSQARYLGRLRESDRKLVDLIRQDRAGKADRATLDIGCGTGIFLIHAAELFPGLHLSGIDLSAEAIEEACTNLGEAAALAVMDVIGMKADFKYDIVVSNAVFSFLSDEEFFTALQSVEANLAEGGSVFLWDWIHDFPQNLVITEKTELFPAGLTMYVRSRGRIDELCAQAGFSRVEHHDFEMPFDIVADRHAVATRTVNTEDGRRLSFRGSICQPWRHLVIGR